RTGARPGDEPHGQAALDQRRRHAGFPRALGAATGKDQRGGRLGGTARPLACPRRRGRQGHRGPDPGKPATVHAPGAEPNAATSFNRSCTPSHSQAKPAKTTSVITSCATFSCAAVYAP